MGLESEIADVKGKKSAIFFPFGWQIAVQIGWSRQKTGKRAFFSVQIMSLNKPTMTSPIPPTKNNNPRILPK
jgi:hypothetical protein